MFPLHVTLYHIVNLFQKDLAIGLQIHFYVQYISHQK